MEKCQKTNLKENLLLTFAKSMQKWCFYYFSGFVWKVPKIQNTRRLNHYLIINYEQILFEYTITRKDESIFLDLWENEFRMLLSTFDLIFNLVESEMRNRNEHSETSCLWLMEIIKRKYIQGCRKFDSFLLWKSFENILQHV